MGHPGACRRASTAVQALDGGNLWTTADKAVNTQSVRQSLDYVGPRKLRSGHWSMQPTSSHEDKVRLPSPLPLESGH